MKNFCSKRLVVSKVGSEVCGASVKRVAIVGSQAFAAVNFRGPLIADLVARGHEVFALAPDFDETTERKIRALGATPVAFSLERTGFNPFVDIRAVIGLWRIFRSLEPDVVLCYFIKSVIYGLIASRLAGVERRIALIEGAGYTFSEAAETSPRRRILRWLVSALYRAALRFADRVFVLNRDDEALFVNTRMARANQLQVLPGIGIDLDHFKAMPSFSTPVTFCLMARLIEEKGVRIYADAAAEIKDVHPQTRFLLLGEVDESRGAVPRADLDRWVTQGVLEWPGKIDDVREYLAVSSVFVLPSYYREGLPRSILEAMAMGRPVITTDNPGCRDAVSDGVEGLVVPVRDARALAHAMKRFIRQPDLIASMGQSARRTAEARYDLKHINNIFLESMGC